MRSVPYIRILWHSATTVSCSTTCYSSVIRSFSTHFGGRRSHINDECCPFPPPRVCYRSHGSFGRMWCSPRTHTQTRSFITSSSSSSSHHKQLAPPPPLRVAIDLHKSYIEHMTEREIRSLCAQISCCYALNSKFFRKDTAETETCPPPSPSSSSPLSSPPACELSIIDDAQPRTHTHTQTPHNPHNRNHTHNDKLIYLTGHLRDKRHAHKWNPLYSRLVSGTSLTQSYSLSSLVYLSPDSPNTLSTHTNLSPSRVYVIGGLVDRSPYPWQSLSRAVSLHVEHARLPIKEYAAAINNPYLHARMNLLNVDHVLHILLQRYYHPEWSWYEVIESVLPKRMYTRRGKFPSGCHE